MGLARGLERGARGGLRGSGRRGLIFLPLSPRYSIDLLCFTKEMREVEDGVMCKQVNVGIGIDEGCLLRGTGRTRIFCGEFSVLLLWRMELGFGRDIFLL
jgi:hypothetical protein